MLRQLYLWNGWNGRPMKILITINCRWWNASAAGALAQAVSLSRRGHSILIQTGPGVSVLERFRESGLETAVLNLSGPGSITAIPAFGRLVRRFSPDVICAHRAEGQTAAAIASGGIPLVRVRSDIRPASGGLLWRRIDSRTDLMVLPGRFMLDRNYVRQRSGPVAVIAHPVDTEYFTPVSGRADSSTLISLARLSPVKGHRTLIRAMALLPSEMDAVIAGSPAQQSREELHAYAEELGVSDRIRFTDRVEDVRSLLSLAFAGVVTSLGSEVVSRAGMEIMSSGLPLLAAATNGLPELVRDGATGLIHPPGNHVELARQAGFLFRNPDAAARLGSNARMFCVEHLGYGVIGERWERHLRAVSEREQLPEWRVSSVSV